MATKKKIKIVSTKEPAPKTKMDREEVMKVPGFSNVSQDSPQVKKADAHGVQVS